MSALHADESDPRSARSAGRRLTGTVSAIVCSVVAAALAAVLGTLLHAQVLYVQDAPVPWGAVAALVLAGAAAVAAATYSGRLWAAALTGALTYGAVALITLDTSNWFIVAWAQREVMPGPALAGAVWVYGLVASTVAALLIAARSLRGDRA
ncbi:hypothetical protein [Zhihengliuella sp.]|uniref:hypothetical protein n=1 Tax=Zhihengliuella sp. TaxID=1954483 RepID=UPI0028123B9B|nr:hypothetical protein [Zhihengliuella sp.]